MNLDTQSITLVIHWSRFGPYHVARLNAAFRELKPLGIHVVGLETASQDKTYGWQIVNTPTIYKRYVAFPGQNLEEISTKRIWNGITSILNKINPQVVAIPGYRTPDALSSLTWCKMHRRATILMSDTKRDDAPRNNFKEWIKSRFINEFDAALCAGKPHRKYLESLGMNPSNIFDGYDVVYNDYFWYGAEKARQDPAQYRSLPGLETSHPFFLASARFIKCKNIEGLLRAYSSYRGRLANSCNGPTPWRLVILGDGEERNILENLIYSEGIQGVSLPGFLQIDVLPAYYGLASVFIHPSYKDTWGLVVNEAMAAGLPVLASNRCGCALDLISEGENGFLFSPEDQAALVDQMVLISSDNVNLRAMGQASRDRINQWTPERFAQGIYGAVQAALSKKRQKNIK